MDGGPHKRWSMWFNSKQREEPYQALTSNELSRDGLVPSGTLRQVLHGCRQLVS
ncbi:putative oRF58e [Pseudomonas savastanoi pv. phaseolicola]|nr:putative oRF58e [Pseudomonas savastanoi pv. phaseolicola]